MIAAINAAGQVVGVVLRDESIRLDQLLELMRQVKAQSGDFPRQPADALQQRIQISRFQTRPRAALQRQLLVAFESD